VNGFHSPNVTRRVRCLAALGVFDRLEVFKHWVVEVHRVTLIKRVDLSPWGDFDLRS
jgi:hypothetical protein